MKSFSTLEAKRLQRTPLVQDIIKGLQEAVEPHSVTVKLLATDPKPLIYIQLANPDNLPGELTHALFDPLLDITQQCSGNEDLIFRGISMDRLPQILTHGSDVEPSNSVIYADVLEKALEYGSNVSDFLAGRPTGKVVEMFTMSNMKTFICRGAREYRGEGLGTIAE